MSQLNCYSNEHLIRIQQEKKKRFLVKLHQNKTKEEVREFFTEMLRRLDRIEQDFIEQTSY
jgi:hypothetical protein